MITVTERSSILLNPLSVLVSADSSHTQSGQSEPITDKKRTNQKNNLSVSLNIKSKLSAVDVSCILSLMIPKRFVLIAYLSYVKLNVYVRDWLLKCIRGVSFGNLQVLVQNVHYTCTHLQSNQKHNSK